MVTKKVSIRYRYRTQGIGIDIENFWMIPSPYITTYKVFHQVFIKLPFFNARYKSSILRLLMAFITDITIVHLYLVSDSPFKCTLFFKLNSYWICHFLGRVSMYLHMIDSITSSAPAPMDINLESLLRKNRSDIFVSNILNVYKPLRFTWLGSFRSNSWVYTCNPNRLLLNVTRCHCSSESTCTFTSFRWEKLTCRICWLGHHWWSPCHPSTGGSCHRALGPIVLPSAWPLTPTLSHRFP